MSRAGRGWDEGEWWDGLRCHPEDQIAEVGWASDAPDRRGPCGNIGLTRADCAAPFGFKCSQRIWRSCKCPGGRPRIVRFVPYSVWIAISAARSQRTHNELSVRPLAEVTVADYESSLRVQVEEQRHRPNDCSRGDRLRWSQGTRQSHRVDAPPAWESAMEYLFAHTASSHLAARGRACSARTHGARRRKQLSTVQGLSPASACAFDGQR